MLTQANAILKAEEQAFLSKMHTKKILQFFCHSSGVHLSFKGYERNFMCLIYERPLEVLLLHTIFLLLLLLLLL